ncbi:hypothetical protein B0A67_15685 [Flavobacterium aquidurense]|uniref:hypothetical protein n=1 Tax=Flavobacterium aquidurense TaxID=362413 RepID=UPI000923669D|nr:hypothetical protein [Flavobacterium aquidurense]OXA70456.1 hypothetical protein B0A67_15685 [Flavobacterium aquidurense]SHH73145.1 hypothetical protein SAMN05444481_12539 [Flavobacterium frigidimaris]
MNYIIIKQIKSITVIAILIFPLVCFSQKDTSKTVINGFSKERKDIPAKIVSNKTIGIVDTIPALIKFKFIDDKNREIELTRMTIANLELRETFKFEPDLLKTDDFGYYSIYLKPANYSLLFHDNTYGELKIDSLKLTSGQIQEIIVNLGSRITIEEYKTIQGETLHLQSEKSN